MNIEIPKRSVLYSTLEPININTLYIESLVHYMERLSRIHVMMISHFLNEFILTSKEANHAVNGRFVSFEKQELLLDKLTFLTCRNDLNSMTFLRWQNVISQKNFFRPTRAWCHKCFIEDKMNQKPIFERLLWTIKKYEFCMIHQLRLTDCCPNCNKKVIISTVPYGYCNKCTSFLGDEKTPIENANPQQIEELRIISTLTNTINKSTPPTRHSFSLLIPELVNLKFEGSTTKFSKKCGISLESARNLCHRESLPQLETYLKIQKVCKISLHSMLDFQLYEPLTNNIPTMRSNKLDKDLVKNELLQLLEHSPPLSLNAVSNIMKITRPRLTRHFPELAKQISDRYKNHFNSNNNFYYSKHDYHLIQSQLLFILKSTSDPLPYNQTIRNLGFCPNFILNKFPKIAKRISDKYQEHLKKTRTYKSNAENLTLEEIKLKLNCEIETCHSPIPLKLISKKLGYHVGTLMEHFPEESKLITTRYKEYQSSLKNQRHQLLLDEIKNAIVTLHHQNIYPSQNKVEDLLAKTALFRNPIITKFWRDNLKSLGYK